MERRRTMDVRVERRGGKREGAGRPSTLEAPMRITVTLEESQVKWLSEQSRPASEIVRELIRKEMSGEWTN